MATPERSNPLQSTFALRWGTQRHLRCKKLEDDVQERDDLVVVGRRSEGGSRIEAIGQKLMLDFKQKMQNLKVGGCGVGAEEIEKAAEDMETAKEKNKAVDGDSSRPWNLRSRRSPAPGPVVKRKSEVGVGVGERSSPVKRLKGFGGGGDEQVKVEFRVSLKKEEIEEDFLMMGGIKPPRRPKKRPRAVQKELDTLFPGIWLTEVTPEKYIVPEAPES